MKTLRIFGLMFFAASFSFILFSCEPDNPDNPDANARQKFIGTYTCVEQSQLSYTVVISASETNASEVNLENFHHLGINEKAKGAIAGYSVTVPEQPLCSGDYIVKGSGLMSASEKSISFQYTVSSGVTTDTINATYTKQ